MLSTPHGFLSTARNKPLNISGYSSPPPPNIPTTITFSLTVSIYLKQTNKRNSTVGKVFALYMAGQGLIPSIHMVPWSPLCLSPTLSPQITNKTTQLWDSIPKITLPNNLSTFIYSFYTFYVAVLDQGNTGKIGRVPQPPNHNRVIRTKKDSMSTGHGHGMLGIL